MDNKINKGLIRETFDKVVDYLLRRKNINTILYILSVFAIKELAAISAGKDIVNLCNEILEKQSNTTATYLAHFLKIIFSDGSITVLITTILLIILFATLKYFEITESLNDNLRTSLLLISISLLVGWLFLLFKNNNFKEPPIEISQISHLENSDLNTSILDLRIRNLSNNDAIINKVEYVVEKIIEEDFLENPEIGPLLAYSAIYDWAINPLKKSNRKEISQYVPKNSIDRFLIVWGIGDYDSLENNIKSIRKEGNNFYKRLKLLGRIKLTYNNDREIISDPFIANIFDLTNCSKVDKNGYSLEKIRTILFGANPNEAYHAISLLRTINDFESNKILKDFKSRDLTYIQKYFQEEYKEMSELFDEGNDLGIEVYIPNPDKEFEEFVKHLNNSLSGLE